jgi:hypothetical protein
MAGRYLLVTCLVVIGAAVAYSLLPLRERVIVRRGGLRVVG